MLFHFLYSFDVEVERDLSPTDKVFIGSILGFDEELSLSDNFGVNLSEDGKDLSYTTVYNSNDDFDESVGKIFFALRAITGLFPRRVSYSYESTQYTADFTLAGQMVNVDYKWFCAYGEMDNVHIKPERYQTEGLVPQSSIEGLPREYK